MCVCVCGVHACVCVCVHGAVTAGPGLVMCTPSSAVWVYSSLGLASPATMVSKASYTPTWWRICLWLEPPVSSFVCLINTHFSFC